MQFVGDARVVDLLLGRELQDQRHQQALHLHAAGGALLHHLLEQDALVRHVLVDDPQAVAAGGDDEALVDLAERAQVREHRKRHLGRRDGLGRKLAMRVQAAQQLAGRRRAGRHFERRARVKSRRGAGAAAEREQ